MSDRDKLADLSEPTVDGSVDIPENLPNPRNGRYELGELANKVRREADYASSRIASATLTEIADTIDKIAEGWGVDFV